MPSSDRPCGLSSSFLSPGPAAPDDRLPSSAGRGPDLTGRPERSVRRPGPTDGPPPGTQTAPGRPPATPAEGPGTADDPLLTIDEVIAELRVSRAAFYRWRRRGAGPAVVRLPGGGVRVRRSALTAWLRRLEASTAEGQERGADGQLRRQVLGHQEARQRHRGTVPGPVGRGRPRALQVVQGPPAGRRVPRRPEGRGPRSAALQPPHWPARSRDHRGGDDHLVRPRPRLRRSQVAEPGPGLAPVGGRGPGHRHRRAHQQGAGRARAEGAAASAVRLGVQPRHPRHRPAARDRRRPRLGRTRLAARRRPGRHRDRAARAGRLRQDPDREAGGRVDPAAQAVGVLQRPRLRGRAGPPAPPTRSTASSGPPPPSRPPSTGGSSSAPPRPRRS